MYKLCAGWKPAEKEARYVNTLLAALKALASNVRRESRAGITASAWNKKEHYLSNTVKIV